MAVGWRGGRRLEFLRFAIFGVWVGRGVGVLVLQLLHPHLCVQASFEEQLLVSATRETVLVLLDASRKTCWIHNRAYRPRSAIRPSLTTRIWSAPMIVDSLRRERDGSVSKEWDAEVRRRREVLPVSDHDRRTVGADFSQRGLDVALRLRVQSRRRLKKSSVRKLRNAA